MGRVVLDSSVVIAALEPADIHHSVAAKKLEKYKEFEFFISAISLTETLMHPFVKGRGVELADRILRVVQQVVPIDSDIAIDAAKIRAEKDLGIGDAIIAATASWMDAELWTFDQKLAKTHPGSVLLS